MPVTWIVKPVTAEWTSETSREKRSGTTVYLAFASEPSTPAAAELAGGGIASIGTNYPGVVLPAYYPCVSRSAVAVNQTRMVFKVTCEFDSSQTGLDENPLNAPVKVSYDPESAEESYFKDTQTPTPKRAIMTSGEPFAELPVRDTGLLTITLEKNVAATTNYLTYEAFIKPKVNSGTVTIDGRGYAAGTLKTSAPKLSDVKELNGIKYRTLTTTLKANEAGWDQKFESRGLYAIEAGTLKRVMVTNAEGQEEPSEVAMPLDEAGYEVPPTTPGFEIVLKPYTAAAFTAIT